MGYQHSLTWASGLARMSVIGQTFHYPRKPVHFRSRQMNRRNLDANSDMDDVEIGRRVVRRLKPIGFTGGHAVGEKVADRVLNAGGFALEWGRCPPGRSRPCLYGLTMGGRIDELFDLDALAQDYREWLTDAPRGTVACVVAEVMDLRRRRLEEFLDFRNVDCAWWLGDRTLCAGKLARCGLLLGYPIQTTVALIRQSFGLSGGVT